jgi:hypothetical protein
MVGVVIGYELGNKECHFGFFFLRLRSQNQTQKEKYANTIAGMMIAVIQSINPLSNDFHGKLAYQANAMP